MSKAAVSGFTNHRIAVKNGLHHSIKYWLLAGLAIQQVTIGYPCRADETGTGNGNQELISSTLSLINQDRERNRCQPLEQNPALCRVAQIYADYLMRTGFFGHIDPFGRNPEDRARYFGVGVPVAENLSWQESSFEDAAALIKNAHAEMMEEPKNQRNHRFNILNPESKFVGLGIAQKEGKIWLVEEFSSQQP